MWRKPSSSLISVLKYPSSSLLFGVWVVQFLITPLNILMFFPHPSLSSNPFSYPFNAPTSCCPCPFFSPHQNPGKYLFFSSPLLLTTFSFSPFKAPRSVESPQRCLYASHNFFRFPLLSSIKRGKLGLRGKRVGQYSVEKSEKSSFLFEGRAGRRKELKLLPH